ncbi:hypothetical protein ACFOVU_29370, partial [Nocardiopsis sediminis]
AHHRGHRPKPDFHALAKKNDEQPGSFEDFVDGLMRKYRLDVEPLAAEHARPWVFFEGTDPNDSSGYGAGFAHYSATGDLGGLDLSTPSPVDDFDFSRFGEVDPGPANDSDGSGDVELRDAPSPTSQGTFDDLGDIDDAGFGAEGGFDRLSGPLGGGHGDSGDFGHDPTARDDDADGFAWGEPSAEEGADVPMGDGDDGLFGPP